MFIDNWEGYFEAHKTLFIIILFLIVFLPVPIFLAVIVHTYRGNRQKFPIVMSALCLLVYTLYFCYCICYDKNHAYDAYGDTFYSFAIGLFSFIHWYIAHTYFECAYINPFM